MVDLCAIQWEFRGTCIGGTMQPGARKSGSSPGGIMHHPRLRMPGAWCHAWHPVETRLRRPHHRPLPRRLRGSRPQDIALAAGIDAQTAHPHEWRASFPPPLRQTSAVFGTVAVTLSLHRRESPLGIFLILERTRPFGIKAAMGGKRRIGILALFMARLREFGGRTRPERDPAFEVDRTSDSVRRVT